MLGRLRRFFDLLSEHKGIRLDLASVPQDDPAVYDMICQADTVGVFQIESRAQMSMLPRLKPRTLDDLTIEVAVVRPGPIQGEMVHPYLRRREGKEPVEYPTPAFKRVLKRTLGIPLFQEQAMAIATHCAGIRAGEADQLRRSMATFKFTGGVSHFKNRLVNGMIANGYDHAFAERTFAQLEGFGSYGFPMSHAASFAIIAYASSWAKCHHPDVFLAAILNSLPMGFYPAAQLVQDARRHGVEVRPVDVNHSRWDCTLEGEGLGLRAVRLGFCMVTGLANKDAARLVAARDLPYRSVQDLQRRVGLGQGVLKRLVEADAFGSLHLDRRQASWTSLSLRDQPLPLFEAADVQDGMPEPAFRLGARWSTTMPPPASA
jgi:error-prone DNA polymerase